MHSLIGSPDEGPIFLVSNLNDGNAFDTSNPFGEASLKVLLQTTDSLVLDFSIKINNL